MMRPRGKVIKSKDELDKTLKPFELEEACHIWYTLARTELAKFKGYKGGIPFPGWELKPTDYTDESNDRRLICLVKTEPVNGRQYEVQLDLRNHTSTMIITGNAQDRALGLVGTDNRAVIKMLNQNSYDFVKSDDFIDRIKMIFASALAMAEDEKAHLTTSDYTALKIALERDQAQFLRLIRKYCDFHTQDHAIRHSKQGDESANTKAAQAKFDEAYDIAHKAVSASINKCARLLESFRSTYYQRQYKVEPDLTQIVGELAQKEVELISARGRPFDIKVSDVIQEGQAIKVVSAQMPLGKKTLPSTNKKGLDPDTKLSNHVRDFAGVIDKEERVHKRTVFDNHSSYCPIEEKDGPTRVWGSYHAAREKVMQLAQAMLDANPELAKSGIDVNLTTLSLLTPYKSEKANKAIQGKNSEYMQLKDVRTALNMLMHGPGLVLGAHGIPIRLQATHMNLPVNVAGAKLVTVNPKLQQEINAKGFYDFREKLIAQLPELQEMKVVMNNTGQALVDDIELYLNNNSPRADKGYREAVNLINRSGAELHDVYHKWHAVLSDYQAGDVTKDHVKNVKSYAEKLNNSLGDAYIAIDSAFEKSFKNKSKEMNSELVKRLHAYLKDPNEHDPEPVRKKLSSLLYGLQAERLYYERFKNDDNQAYDFHVNYLMSNYSMQQLVEFFCKSAEDRTGALRIKLFAHMMFEEIHHRPPNLNDKSDAYSFLKYSKLAHEITVSLENTKHNSQARGLQVKEIFTINGYNMSAGKLMGALAKEPYKEKVTQEELMKYLADKDAEKAKKPSVLGFLGTRTRADRAASKEQVSASTLAAGSPTVQRTIGVESSATESASKTSRPSSPGRKA